jgi:hypothetical protein
MIRLTLGRASAVVIFILVLAAAARAQESALLWGRVLDQGRRPLPAVRVIVTVKDAGRPIETATDEKGFFRLVSFPWGEYSVRFEADGFQNYEEKGLFSEPSSRLFLRIILSRPKSGSSSVDVRRPDRQDFHQTLLDQDQIQAFPSGNNVWNLVENQDLAAITDRIDVGGLHLGQAALFSPRASSSWTQTTYGLNGLDVTDPFWAGRPLFYPDLFTYRFTELDNARLPVRSLHPGAAFELITKEAGDRFQGGLWAFYSDRNFAASNITPSLIKEGISETNVWNSLADIHFELSAPLVRDKLGLYVSLTSQSLARDLADYRPEDSSSVLAGLISLDYSLPLGRLKFLWTGQAVHQPSEGAGRGILPEETRDTRQGADVFQLLWDRRLADHHALRAGLGYVRGTVRSDFQDWAVGPCRVDILPDRFSGAAPSAGQDNRQILDSFLEGRLLLTNVLGGANLLDYGLGLRYAGSSSSLRILDNIHLLFFKGLPLEVVRFNTPLEHKEASLEGRLYFQDTLILASFISLTAGLQAEFSRGWAVGSDSRSAITWLNLSPRLGFSLPLARRSDSSLSFSAARYYFTLPLNYLLYGHSQAPGGLVYAWNDKDHDFQFDEGETGSLIRREGPAFAALDPKLKRPYTDELTAALKIDLGAGWSLALAGFLRETRHLVETLNTGVPFSSYTPLPFHESGDDLVPGSWDDLDFIIYNQNPATLGKDFFLLTNPESDKRISRFRGLDLTLVRRHSRTFNFFLSLQAIEAIGTASPGNTAWDNDDGVVGALYDNPNTLICAKGRLCFDRGYTGRVGFSWSLPAGFRLAAVIKYYDGQPFARLIVVTGLNQGPFFIMAHPRGVTRYEYNRTVDVRLEKMFRLGGARLRLFADGFNIFNRNLALSEDEWTGPAWPLRLPTEIQSPRLFRFGLAYEF